jgi:hypothetical protein
LTHARQDVKNVDPIFSAPYKPSQTAPAALRPAAPQREPRQLASLLGGFPKNK